MITRALSIVALILIAGFVGFDVSTAATVDKILDESYRCSVEALSNEGFMPQEAFAALVEQLVSQKSIDEAAGKKLPLTAYFDNRFVNELEKEGFFKKLW